MARSKVLNEYLANKHRGGENNQKGGLYEDFYAVFQIVSCLAKYKHQLDDVSFQTQLEDTFVDDLLIAQPDVNVYHQLKNTQQVAWGKVEKIGDIAFDFAHQIEDCKERDESFALKLIFSVQKTSVKEEIPELIEGYSEAEWFPYQQDINQLVLISSDLKKALRSISAEGADAQDDQLANIATLFLGVWRGANSKSRVSLSDLIKKAESEKRVNLAIYPDTVISKECKKILDAIVGIEYHVSGRMFYWRFGFMKGECPWPDEMEQKIIDTRPRTKLDLIALLG